MKIKPRDLDTIPRHGRSRSVRTATETQSHEKLVEAFIDRIRVRIEAADTPTLREMVDRLVECEPQSNTSPAADSLVNVLSQGRQYSSEEALLMELELQRRGFELRRNLLKGALTTVEVAQLLGTKRQTPHDRLKQGTLLGIEENGRWLFPYWQFDPAGPNGVVKGLVSALRALQTSAVAKANWFMLPNPYLEGRTPIQALKDGDAGRVADIARAVGAN